MTEMTRREWMIGFGFGAIGIACGGSEADPAGPATGASTSSSSASSASSSASSSSGSPGVRDWATGGTKSMTAASSYPDPFSGATGEPCVVMPSLTAGPCTEGADQDRRDISEGAGGLPVRLSLRVVDASCEPIPNAKVKIWHTQSNGGYTGDTPNNAFCLKDPLADAKIHSFRGVRVTDSEGRVDFDTCFPGWYPGRTIHIHFTVTAGGKSFTSQVVFDDSLVASIFAAHPEYEDFGQPDTTNVTDVIVKGSAAPFTMNTARMSDGAMLASKVLVCQL